MGEHDATEHLRNLRDYLDTITGRRDESLAVLLKELTPGGGAGERLAVVMVALEVLLGAIKDRPIPLPGGGTLDPRTLLMDPTSNPAPIRFSLVLADRLSVDFPAAEAAGRTLQA